LSTCTAPYNNRNKRKLNFIKNKEHVMALLPKSTEIKRITKVFQGLTDLIERETSPQGNIDCVPEEIQSLVLNLQLAHKNFEEGINEYMHKKRRDVSEVKTMKTIVEEGPDYLMSTSKFGGIPILYAALDDSSASTYVPLLANAAIQHGILAEENERGGLLVKGTVRKRAWIKNIAPLSILAHRGNLSAFKALQDSKPSLFTATDVGTKRLIHLAVNNNQVEMVKMLIDINPAAIYHTNMEIGKLPIHFVRTSEIANFLLKSAIRYDPNHSSIGGLFAKDSQRKMPINHLIRKFGKEDAIKCIEESLSISKHIPILHKAILHTPDLVDDIITSFPDSCLVRDENGRLPIHVALENGMQWSLALSSIMYANSDHLNEIDPVTKFCPIALAALEPACDLKTINYLLHKDPKQVEFSTNKNDKVRSRSSINDNFEHKSKRQRLTNDP
jgi:hypothetical protein